MKIILKETTNPSNSIDISNMIAFSGYTEKNEPVDSADSGENIMQGLDTTRFGWRRSNTIMFIPLTTQQKRSLEEFFKKTYITVELYYDYGLATHYEETHYAQVDSSIDFSHMVRMPNGSDKWKGFSVTLLDIDLT